MILGESGAEFFGVEERYAVLALPVLVVSCANVGILAMLLVSLLTALVLNDLAIGV